MTICVAVRVHDCLVFSADSALSLVNGNETLNVYEHGNKVFNLVKQLPVCAMFNGMGNIGRSSMATLTKDLRRSLSSDSAQGGLDRSNYTIANIAQRTYEFLEQRYLEIFNEPQTNHYLEFFVGGYSAGGEMAEVWKINLSEGVWLKPEQQMPNEEGAYVLWGGQPEALNRLLLGFSQYLPQALFDSGIHPDAIPQLIADIRQQTAEPLAVDSMPTGDAIALAEFLVDLTKKYVHFKKGADTVGGDTDIATVTRHEGFKWIKRKHFYPRALNLETDHA